MHYLGGKARTYKQIARHLNGIRRPGQAYWEPMVGAAWILQAVHGGKRYAGDLNPYLVAMWQAIQAGWIPPGTLAEQEYLAIKNRPEDYPPELVAFAGFGCSFGGKWFAGYARSGNRNYASNARNSLLSKKARLVGVEFAVTDIFTSQPPEAECLIYLDPPYKGTTGYGAIGNFDNAAFWDRVREFSGLGHTVVISEYQAPSDFECVLSIATKTDMHTHNGKEGRTERLFTHATSVTSLEPEQMSFWEALG